jgi:aspartyl-tRNA synthetase
MLRTHHNGELRKEHAGETVSLCGWIDSRRDHKGTIFVDLRDRFGRTQCVFRHGEGEDAVALGKGSELPLETCVRLTGTVSERPEGLRNEKLATGDIELLVTEVEVLGEASPPPIDIADEVEVADELRMKYRYIDMRRKPVMDVLVKRHRIVQRVRRYFDENGFIEVETPILTKSTPEGARDYLVPSRERKGSFYALPQSPQLFKQLLMVGGLDRYFQIPKCFRDEDLRADRQPEFTQIDVEMSFVTEDDVLEVLEDIAAGLLAEFRGVELERPFPRMSYAEAVARFGNDKPDLRFGLEIEDVTEHLVNSEFRAFSETAAAGGRIRAIRAVGGGSLSRKQITGLEDVARENGAKGLLWLKVTDEGLTGPAAKFLSEAEAGAVLGQLGAASGDLLLLAADREAIVAQALGAVRLALGDLLGMIPEDEWRPVFIVDWPLLEWNEEEERYDALHHPFTSPRDEDLDRLETEPASVGARAYDLVLNGVELGGGSIRIHRPDVQNRVFRAVGIPEEDAQAKFGFLLEALTYGAPPHGGFAIGFDRLVSLLVTGRDWIREVIAFPKTTSAACPLTGAPAPVSPDQVADLGLAVTQRDEGE